MVFSTGLLIVAAACGGAGSAAGKAASTSRNQAQPAPDSQEQPFPKSKDRPPLVSHLSAAQAAGTVTRRGAELLLGGKPWLFDGLDAYGLGSDSGHNVGCGTAPSPAELNDLFAHLPPATVVRAWAFQASMGINPATGERDWTGLDRLVAAADTHHVKLILSLGSQAGTCDGGQWKEPSWYAGGYARVPTGSQPAGMVSYEQWVSEVVERYRSSTTIAMYEPINEPEASTCAPGFSGSACYAHLTCVSESRSAAVLRSFFDQVGGEIHRLNPAALVEEGTIGGGQCGTSDADYAWVGASPALDVLSVHDYSAPGAILAGDRYNGQRVRLAQAETVGKPIIAGEIGIEGATAPGRCPDLGQRTADLVRKVDADLTAGYSGALVWDYRPNGPSKDCSYNLSTGDPYLAWLASG